MPTVTTSAPSGDVASNAERTSKDDAGCAADGQDDSGTVSTIVSGRPLVLVSGATKTARPAWAGHLIVPRQWHRDAAKAQLVAGRWAMDNGGFGGLFDVGGFVSMLEHFTGVDGCLFVTAPDVIYSTGIGDHAATVTRWPFWARLIQGLGHRPAFVLQDGCECWRDVPADATCLFVGGSTAYKESESVRTICGVAKARGLWVHWGRVNSKRRYELALIAGCDSLDGTGFSMFPDTNLPKVDEWHERIKGQPMLSEGGA